MVNRAIVWLLAAAFAAGCAAPSGNDVAGIADQEPLPYSVLLTGGGFVEVLPLADGGDDGLAETFGASMRREPLPLDQIVRALQAGRVFARTLIDTSRDEGARAEIATHRAELPLHDAAVRRLLDEARAAGHDFVVVVQRLVDGPVEDYGINDRWPLTVSLWLLVGLGMFIPDHSFESRATLQAGVYEVHTGRLVHRAVGSAGPVELSLVGRGNAWGIVQSIIIPPFWVASSDASLLAEVRSITRRRLVVGLARQLKSAACRQDLIERSRATIDLVEGGDGHLVRVLTEEPIGTAALRADGRAVVDADSERFTARMVASERSLPEGGFQYEVRLPTPLRARFLQILVRTVAGDVASVTFDLEER